MTDFKTKNNRINSMELMEWSKLPPQALDLEEAVLGALMIEREALGIVEDLLIPSSFYKDGHQKIYSAILSLSKCNTPIDILTVANELKNKGNLEIVGGPYYIATLTNRVASAANVEFHSRIIQQKFLSREVIRLSGEVIKAAYDDGTDVFELISDTEIKLSNLNQQKGEKSFVAPLPLIKEILRVNTILLEKKHLSGVPTGFIELDRVTGGWQKGDLIILAARPGMGKTSLAVGCAVNAALQNVPVAFFSLEVSDVKITRKVLSNISEVPLNLLTKKGVDEVEMKKLQVAITAYENAPLYIDDTGGLSIQKMRKKARKVVKENGVKLIIADYLQLAETEEKTNGREQEINKISRKLKALAKELDVPVIALSQLSREVDKRQGNKMPVLSDLRDSGAIEQDADIVMFIYRPEYYGELEDEKGKSNRGKAIVRFAKFREGETQDVYLGFKDYLTKFTNYGETESYPPTSKMSANTGFYKDDKPF